MFINQLKLVFRRLKRSPFYTFVNVLGLTLGLTAVLFIAIYVADERSFDRFHTDADHIYRLTSSHERLGKSGRPPLDFVEYFAPDIPEITGYSRLAPKYAEVMVSADETDLNVKGVTMIDPNFFQFFSFELTDGLGSQVFANSASAVISESMAKKFFGDENPLGKEVVIEKAERYVITGIAADPPGNSTIQYNLLLYKEGHFKNQFEQRHGVRSAITYVKLDKASDKEKVVEGIMAARDKPSYARFTQENEFDLMSIKKERLEADFTDDPFEHNDLAYVRLFIAIGLAVLLLALINYVNLVTAQSIKKMKEVGLRKVIGARKGQLMLYHLLESSMLTLLSFLLAFGLVERLMPIFNELTAKDIQIELFSLNWLGFGVLFSIALGLLSGLYPAYYINRVKPLSLMSRFATAQTSGKGFKTGLVLFQFVATAILIVVLVIMKQQMDYLEEKDLGFDTDLVLSVPLSRDSTHLFNKLKSEFEGIQGVDEVSLSGFRIGGSAIVSVMHGPNTNGENSEGERVGGDAYTAVFADEDLIGTLDIEFFWQSSSWDGAKLKEGEMIINYSLAEKLGWLDDPIGKKLYDYNGSNGKAVVGIVYDMHIKSLKKKVEPMVIYPIGDWGTNTLLVKLNPGAGALSVSQMADSFSQMFDRPFSYELLETQVARFYAKERGQYRLFQVFSMLALFISLLGLLALTTYTLQQRRKEISIRKVLGASLRGLILMLNREYALMVLIAFAVASPIAWLSMEKWLADFSYRIEVSPLLFVITFLGFMLLCWAITAGQSLKVSRENPADVLRDE